jgi:hypothetical protein
VHKNLKFKIENVKLGTWLGMASGVFDDGGEDSDEFSGFLFEGEELGCWDQV